MEAPSPRDKPTPPRSIFTVCVQRKCYFFLNLLYLQVNLRGNDEFRYMLIEIHFFAFESKGFF